MAGELEGNPWNIYSQNIGTSPFNTAPATVTITSSNSTSKFPFTNQAVTFNPAGTVPGREYFRGKAGNYLYRAQKLTHKGLTLLVGHVSTTDQPDPHRVLFVGLPQKYGLRKPITLLDLTLFEIHLYDNDTTPHNVGSLKFNYTTKKISVKRETESNFNEFTATCTERTNDIQLKAEKGITPNKERLEARIIFNGSGSPIYLGYYWREAEFDKIIGPAGSEYCTRVTIGW